MASRDYIPRGHAAFNEWYTNLINYIRQVTFTQNNPWTHIPNPEANAFVALLAEWTAAYTPTLAPSTHPQKVARDETSPRPACLPTAYLVLRRR